MSPQEMMHIKEKRGYSFAQLASYTGVPAVTLQKVFSGKSKNPRPATLYAIERVLLGDEKTYSGKSYDYEAAGKSAGDNASGQVPYNSDKNMQMSGGEVCESSAYAVKKEKKQGEYTLEDYYNIPEEERVELIDGVFWEMNSPKVVHQDCAFLFHMTIHNYVRKNNGACKVFEAPVDVQLDCDNRTIVQPDVLVVCDRSKIKEQVIYGAPDFVLEILSTSTRKKDMTLKLQKYLNAGVREYWILDPERKRLIMYNFMEENWIPEIRMLEGNAPLAIFDGKCQVNLDEIAESIREFG